MIQEFILIGLGSNLGDRALNLDQAYQYLKKIMVIIGNSSVHETIPMYNSNQGLFLNQVIMGQSSFTPLSLLSHTKSIEKVMGRECSLERNTPRCIDIDIIDYNGIICDYPNLTLPHPKAHERPFVLDLIHEIHPTWICPNLSTDKLK